MARTILKKLGTTWSNTPGHSTLDDLFHEIYMELEGRDRLSQRLIKIGALIFVLPILGISELIGVAIMALGGIIGIFRRRYPISRVGIDLSSQIKELYEFRKELG